MKSLVLLLAVVGCAIATVKNDRSVKKEPFHFGIGPPAYKFIGGHTVKLLHQSRFISDPLVGQEVLIPIRLLYRPNHHRGEITLLSGYEDNADIALRILFDEEISFQSRSLGNWTEETSIPYSEPQVARLVEFLKKNPEEPNFYVKIKIMKNHFEIHFDQYKVMTHPFSVPIQKIRYFTIYGEDSHLHNLFWSGTPLPKESKYNLDWEPILQNHDVTFFGQANADIIRFRLDEFRTTIELYSGEINMDLNQNAAPAREKVASPIKRGDDFKLTIQYTRDSFEIYSNMTHLFSYAHQIPWGTPIRDVEVEGEGTIYSVQQNAINQF